MTTVEQNGKKPVITITGVALDVDQDPLKGPLKKILEPILGEVADTWAHQRLEDGVIMVSSDDVPWDKQPAFASAAKSVLGSKCRVRVTTNF